MLPDRILLSTIVFSLLLGLAGCQQTPSQDQQKVVNVVEVTELLGAARNADLDAVVSLIKSGAQVNAITPEGTALTKGAEAGSAPVVLALLKAGADPNAGVTSGQASALHHMAAAGKANGVLALSTAGADLEHLDGQGHTPLALAIKNGHLSTAKTLIKAGCDVNAVAADRSLLMTVVEQNSLLMAQLLVDAGVNVNYRNNAGETALGLAQRLGRTDLQMLLLQSGART